MNIHNSCVEIISEYIFRLTSQEEKTRVLYFTPEEKINIKMMN